MMMMVLLPKLGARVRVNIDPVGADPKREESLDKDNKKESNDRPFFLIAEEEAAKLTNDRCK